MWVHVKLGHRNTDCVCKWVLRRLEKTAQRGASRCVLIAKKCSSDCNKKGDGLGMWHVCEKQQLHTGFWWGNLRERRHLEDVDDDGKIILKWIFEKKDGRPCTGFMCIDTVLEVKKNSYYITVLNYLKLNKCGLPQLHCQDVRTHIIM